MTGLFYPRLPEPVAGEILRELTPLTPIEIREHSATAHGSVTWYPTSTRRADSKTLRTLQRDLRDTAAQHGYPTVANRRSSAFRTFDQDISRVLFDQMAIVPADAASDDVWSFLSLVLAPDVAFWRFPNRDAREDYERLLGRPRNVFRRLWWRSFSLGPEVSAQLHEDEAVAIMERPTLGGDPRVARAVALSHLAHIAAEPDVGRTDLLREATKRIRRISVIIPLSALGAAELSDLTNEIFADALAAIRKTAGD